MAKINFVDHAGETRTVEVDNGATVRGEPGVWKQYSERYYAAFVNDLHRNNVEAVWHAPEPVVMPPEAERLRHAS